MSRGAATCFFLAALAGGCRDSGPTLPHQPARPRVIFVGLDGGDWELLDRYAGDGTMPNLGRLVR